MAKNPPSLSKFYVIMWGVPTYPALITTVDLVELYTEAVKKKKEFIEITEEGRVTAAFRTSSVAGIILGESLTESERKAAES